MKYIVSIAVDGRTDVEVEADSIREAREKALFAAADADFNAIDFITLSAVNVTDEEGNLIDY